MSAVVVTVRDVETGEQSAQDVADGDYFILCTGSCYVAHVASYPTTGTHILPIKGRTQP